MNQLHIIVSCPLIPIKKKDNTHFWDTKNFAQCILSLIGNNKIFVVATYLLHKIQWKTKYTCSIQSYKLQTIEFTFLVNWNVFGFFFREMLSPICTSFKVIICFSCLSFNFCESDFNQITASEISTCILFTFLLSFHT